MSSCRAGSCPARPVVSVFKPGSLSRLAIRRARLGDGTSRRPAKPTQRTPVQPGNRRSPSRQPGLIEGPRPPRRTVFGYDDFRPLQAEIIANILAGRDTLAVMPTGSGKSSLLPVARPAVRWSDRGGIAADRPDAGSGDAVA